MNALTRTQLGLIREIRSALGAAGIHWWLFGGWGLDARIGHVTRDHHDIEFWVFHEDADSTREALMACGFEAPESLRPLTHAAGRLRHQSVSAPVGVARRGRSRGLSGAKGNKKRSPTTPALPWAMADCAFRRQHVSLLISISVRAS